MNTKEEQIALIYKAFKEAVTTVKINEKNYKKKLSLMYALCANKIEKKYLKIIPKEAKKSYSFLIKFKKDQIVHYKKQNQNFPQSQNLDTNYMAFFHTLRNRTSKAIQSIYEIFFILQNEIYTTKEEYNLFIL